MVSHFKRKLKRNAIDAVEHLNKLTKLRRRGRSNGKKEREYFQAGISEKSGR